MAAIFMIMTTVVPQPTMTALSFWVVGGQGEELPLGHVRYEDEYSYLSGWAGGRIAAGPRSL